MYQNTIIKRFFATTTPTLKKLALNNLKGKKVSSQQWLSRQLSDPYVEKARMMNYRCRSAFKLIEMDDRFKFLSPGQKLVDCGAAPGSWTQVAVQRVNALGKDANDPIGRVISIDRTQFFPIEGAMILGNADFTKPETQSKLKEIISNEKLNIVLSDMAPNATGIREMDVENILSLCYSVLRFAVQMSEVGATIIVKLWQCEEAKKLEQDMLKFYNNVRVVKPNSSRSDSAEIFLLGREFKGLK